MSDSVTRAITQLVRTELSDSIASLRAQLLSEIRAVAVESRHECGCFEPTWTTKQAAEFLGIARSTLYNEISKGTFPRPRKQGRINAFVPSEVAEVRRVRLGLTE